MDTFIFASGSIITGFIVGILSGLLGIGGGTVLVTIFKLGYGMSAIASTATSLFTIIPTSISGAITHIRNKTCIPKLGLAAGLGGALLSPVGVRLASISPEWCIIVAAALVIGYSATTMLQKAIKLTAAQKKAAEAQNTQTQDAQQVAESSARNTIDRDELQARYGARHLALCVVIGMVAGLLSGYVGVGGGFLIIPLMMQLLKTPMKLTSGTSLIAVMILAIPGTVTQAMLGNIDWIAGICIAIGSIPGAFIGSKLIKRVPEVALRYIFSAFLFISAALLVINQTGIF